MPYTCDNEDGAPAVLLVTNLDTGDSMSPCAECAPVLLRSIADLIDTNNTEPIPLEATDPATGDETDEDEHTDGQPLTPAVLEPLPPAPAPEDDDEDQADADADGAWADTSEDDEQGLRPEPISAATG